MRTGWEEWTEWTAWIKNRGTSASGHVHPVHTVHSVHRAREAGNGGGRALSDVGPLRAVPDQAQTHAAPSLARAGWGLWGSGRAVLDGNRCRETG